MIQASDWSMRTADRWHAAEILSTRQNSGRSQEHVISRELKRRDAMEAGRGRVARGRGQLRVDQIDLRVTSL